MQGGEVVADRFVIQRPVGGGGMGSVFVASDRVDGGLVAVKVMDGTTGDVNRFGREARLLAELSHPALVRYVTHGRSSAGEYFIVMQWLDGHDLAQRLETSPLTIEESVAVVRRAASGLAAAHARGVVHRDVKPSNLFLVGKDPERTKVLDFGIARDSSHAQTMTQTGTLLGTVGYMAPEQARGESSIDARADVFGLGCVLFECLTGRPAFAGRHAVAVLAKVLCEQPPLVSEIRPGLGAEIDDLVGRMLAKEREGRPSDAQSVLDELDRIGGVSNTPALVGQRAPSRITGAERRVVSVILAERKRRSTPGVDSSASFERTSSARPPESADTAPNLLPPVVLDHNARIGELAARFGANVARLDGGAVLVTLSGRGTAGDQATQAATCALALRRLYPDLRIALATGRAETLGRLPVGPAIDRAAALLRTPQSVDPHADADDDAVLIDDLTGALLDPRFEVRRSATRIVLVREQGELEGRRLLLGKATPCVGREKELAFLEAALDECIGDGVARAVLVVAPPGTGKSRLATELLRRVEALDKARVLFARADPVAGGAPLDLAQRLVRHAAGLLDGDPPDERGARLRRHVESLQTPDTERLVEFLAELVNVPTDRPPSVLLRSAREDAAVMSEQKRRAFHGFLAAESAARPLLVVLEDLHWGDHPTVAYLDDALKQLADRPILVFSLGRPELYEQFPRLFEHHGLQELRLGGLTRRAAERLVRSVLGPDVDESTLGRIVKLADGNAFYLEELIRRVAEGAVDLPETVLSMAQSRLDRIEPEARRVLRAASVFGETFWRGGVGAIIGVETDTEEWLDTLVERELLVRAPQSRFTEDREYQFRHALLRDAAYGMLTEEDLAVAHGLAAEWLERAGELSAQVIAEHFERAAEPARAVPWIVRAAKASLDGGDVQSAVALAEKGAALGAEGESLGLLLVISAEGLGWDGQFGAALETSRNARALLAEGSTAWWRATASFVAAATASGRPEEAASVIEALVSSTPDLGQHPIAAARACTWLVLGLIIIGQGARAEAFLDRIGATEANLEHAEPLYAAWLSVSMAALAILVNADLGRAVRVARKSVATMREAGDALGEASALSWAGAAAWEMGLAEETLATFERVRELSDAAGGSWLKGYAAFYIAAVRIRQGDTDGIDETLAALRSAPDVSAQQLARALTVELHLRNGRVVEALEEARLAASGPSVVIRPTGEAVAARILLALGRPAEALDAANRGLAQSSTINPQWLVWLLLARAEALRAIGDLDGARDSIRAALDRVRKTAATLDDPAMKESFLTRLESSVQALALARDWLGESPSTAG